jgi:hypothetical protein
VNLEEISIRNKIIVYPNPFNSFTTIEFNIAVNNGELSFYNILGEKVKTISNISGQTITLNKDGLNNGLYFLKLIEETKVIAKSKIMIE